jgi:long-chain acyl-CoA synthetase
MTELRIRRELHYGDRMMRCIADRPSGVDELFRAAVTRRPDGAAIASAQGRLSYAELNCRVECIVSNLLSRGFVKGERIGLLVGNRPEFLMTVLAAARLGMVVVPMNVRQRAPEILHMMAHSGAVALVLESALLHEVPPRSKLPSIRAIFVTGDSSQEHAEQFDALLARGAAQPQISVPAVEEEPFCILYTSGTTGRPKGAVLTHLGVVHSILHYESGLDLRDADVAALAVPASHVTGLIAILLAMLRVAGTTVMMERFKAGTFLAAIESERISYTLMVPAMYNLCLLEPGLAGFDLASWRVGGFGGAPMPAATIQRLAEAIPTLGLSNIYGATETTSPVSILPASDALDCRDTVGRLVPCADVVVADAHGLEVRSGERGELLIAGPMVIPGYWDDETANSTSFVAGYWRSGDIGSVNADGYISIHDRKKDVINRGGYKIYCVEVESVIAEHPGVLECAVVGYPDSVLGERVQAFISTVTGSRITARDLVEFCSSRLSDYKVPERVTFVPRPLPRNANGKIIKSELRLE